MVWCLYWCWWSSVGVCCYNFYHFLYVLLSLLLLFAVLLQCVDDFYCFAFQISRSFLSPWWCCIIISFVFIMRRFRGFKSRKAGFLCLWFVWVLILICCLLGWFRGICWCVSECPFSFKLVGPRNISLHLIHKLFNISYCVVGVGLRGGMVCIQRCDDFGGIGGFLVVGHLCDFVICYS